MTQMHVSYHGSLRCELTHEPTHSKIITNGPKELGGSGDSFSPTDLIGVSLASCMMTFMGLTANKYKFDITGTTAEVDKEMITAPIRRIGKINITFNMAKDIPADKREALEQSAHSCPVSHSLHPDTILDVKFIYPN